MAHFVEHNREDEAMGTYVPRGYDVYWDNGKWVAIREADGNRRNIARPNCQTKQEAVEDARDDRDILQQDGVRYRNGQWTSG